MSEEMILVTLKRYRELQERELWADALDYWGVDNWSGGYDQAREMYDEGVIKLNDTEKTEK